MKRLSHQGKAHVTSLSAQRRCVIAVGDYGAVMPRRCLAVKETLLSLPRHDFPAFEDFSKPPGNLL